MGWMVCVCCPFTQRFALVAGDWLWVWRPTNYSIQPPLSPPLASLIPQINLIYFFFSSSSTWKASSTKEKTSQLSLIELMRGRGAAAHNPQIQREEANSTNQQNKCFTLLCFVVVDLFAAPEEEKKKTIQLRSNNQLFFACCGKKRLILLWLAAQRWALLGAPFNQPKPIHDWFHSQIKDLFISSTHSSWFCWFHFLFHWGSLTHSSNSILSFDFMVRSPLAARETNQLFHFIAKIDWFH